MKTEINEHGWSETTTVNINLTSTPEKPFMSVPKWIESNKRLGFTRKRKRCNCCKTEWGKLSGYVFLVFTDKGNKTICEKCVVKFS